ncbi:CaiB/BaiF CoA transferase family protein [Halosegnis sp.]|uniref:CaiB/BaiF CoA transferase family protein n=1 Tax=Halosegnis sp. TaxID=2864959 RepID=UPI0035D3F9D5
MDLGGVRVLDLTRLLPGPYATQLLADAGADVVKVESPDRGDYAREMPPTTDEGVGRVFDAVNRGKRSVALDLTTDTGLAAFDALAAEADAVIEGFAPGTAEQLGVGHKRLREVNPELVYCSLSGYGGTGPRRDRPGHDLNYVAATGLLDMNRQDDSEQPRVPGAPVADMAGGLAAAVAVLAGLLSREVGDGGGTYIDASLAEAALSVTMPTAALAFDNNPRPGETPLSGAYPWYDIYEASDGWVTLAALEEPYWVAFCEAAGRPELADAHGTTDTAERAALRETLADLFAERSATEWERLCGDTGMLARVQTPREAVSDETFRERGVVHDGRVGFPAQVNGSVPSGGEAVPARGEHTEELLQEVNFDPDRL